MLRTLIYFHVYIILDIPITYRNASVLCQSECTCLHKTVNMVVFFVKSNENTYPKVRALQIYRVVPITKRELINDIIIVFLCYLTAQIYFVYYSYIHSGFYFIFF